MLDVDFLLQPASDDLPSGEALDYDIGYLQLEIAARGRSEQQIGDAISAGAEPDWPQVETLAIELSARSKDIRVAILLARALLQGEGFAGLDQALRLLAGYTERFWDTLHPAPEPDEDDTIRMNALAALADPAGLLGEIRRAPLVRSNAIGAVSLRDLQIARHELAPGADAPEIAQVDIEAAFLSAGAAEIAATAAALAGCQASIDAMTAALAARDNAGFGDQFEAIRTALGEARKEIDSRVALPVQAEENAGPAAPAPMPRASFGEIRGRTDVVAQLETICRWYAANEPASPVPILLDRAKRLVSQDFLALITELAPAGLDQFRNLAGIHDGAA
jgi:type VI secretion system protein ImpA